MFQIVDNSKIQAHLLAFEKDAYRVKEGQTVTFTVESAPGETFSAKIYSVGKTFEENPKAVRVHAEVDNRKGLLIAGTYIKGRIATDVASLPAVPEDAVVQVNSKKLEKHVTSSVTCALEGVVEMRLYATRLTTETISFQAVTSSCRLFYYPCS